jgi:site-specific recombinase XerD
MNQIVPIRGARAPSTTRQGRRGLAVPAAIAGAGDTAVRRFLEFFAATIRNKNTRMAYYRAVTDFFGWLDAAGILLLVDIEPLHVATYIEALQERMAKPTVKQHLAAIHMLFDWLVTGAVLATNPATSVRGPKHDPRADDRSGPRLDREHRHLDPRRPARSRPDWCHDLRLRAHRRRGVDAGRGLLRQRQALVGPPPREAHHKLEAFLDEYIRAAGIAGDDKSPLFRSGVRRTGTLAATAMHRVDAWRMIQRRSTELGMKVKIGCHTFRATGITAYLEAGGTLENAQLMAAHESPRTTKLYDRTGDEITLDEVERITI